MLTAAFRRPLRVLLVDDDPRYAELLSLLIGVDGRADVVAVARDGVEAVELARANRPDVVVMDLHMPRMDGFEATRRIRRRLPKTRVLVVSSSSDPLDVERAREAGAAAYVTKDRAESRIADDIAGRPAVARARRLFRLEPLPTRP